MCGRVIAVLLLLGSLFSAPTGYSQCSWTPRFSGDFRSTALDVSVDATFVWVATGYGVQLYEQSATGPRLADTIALPALTRTVRADGSGIAYAGSGSSVYVLRRNGKAIERLRAVDAGATVNDIEVSTALFVATASGIAHFDRFDPANPTRTNVSLPTTAPNVSALAIAQNTLYAADGDATVEVYSITSIPQRTGSIGDLPRSTAVHTTVDGLVLISDRFGQNTDVYAGTTRLARLPFGATAFADGPRRARFMAGPDRTLRAVDFSNASRVTQLFEAQLAPTDGTDNTIHAAARSGESLYVAAGDIGLVAFDVSSLKSPYPMAAYSGGATTSVLTASGRSWFAESSGRVTEYSVVGDGVALTPLRNWNAPQGSILLDVRGDLMLTSSGATATIWSLAGAAPASTGTTTFSAGITSGVLRDGSIVVRLADGSVWTAAAGSAPQRASVPAATLIARSGSALAAVEVRESGQSVVHYYATGELTSETRSVTIDGAAVGGLALDATRAALFTFRGVNVVDLASGNVSVLAGSNQTIPRRLRFAGDDLLLADATQLFIYSRAGALLGRRTLPSAAADLDASAGIALLATEEGALALAYATPQPEARIPLINRFYTKAVAAGGALYLLTDDGVDIYATVVGDTPHFVGAARPGGVIDLAATSERLFTLAANGAVSAWGQSGALLAQITLNEGADAQPLSIATAGNAVWVSLSKGCQSGACQKKTIVLDPQTLVSTATLEGGVVDLTASSPRASVLFDLPDEIRVFDIADPLHPSQLAVTAAPATAVSIGAAGGKVYALGDKVYVFAESTLAPAGTQLSSATATATQRIRIDGGCAVITGRSANPEVYRADSWVASTPLIEVPSPVKTIAMEPGRFYLLTEHSLEVWSSKPAQLPGKRRAAR